MSTKESAPSKATKRTVRGKDFKTAVATTFSLRLNDNLCEITFGYETAEGGEEVIVEETRVLLTPRSLKVLSILLGSAIPRFEQLLGGIALPAGKEDELERMLDSSGLTAVSKKKEAAN